MSLEVKIETLTAAVEALTAAIAKGGVAASTAPAASETPEKKTRNTAKKEEKTEAPTAKSKHSRDDVIAALNEVKEKKGVADAKAVIKTAAGVDKMADIPEEKLDAVYDAAKEALEDGEDM